MIKLMVNNETSDKARVAHITFNLTKPQTRIDKIGDREYLVVPMIMINEGVHEGSDGPLYYPAEELAKIPQAWNHKPTLVYHPVVNGKPVSGCDPVVLATQGIGMILNTRFEKGSLKAEAWIDQDQMNRVDNRIGKAIDKGQTLELSTGLYMNVENTEGEWNGEKYVGVARNYIPDHLAVLPDKIGACSVADGAGFLRVNAQKEAERLSSLFLRDYGPILEAAGIDTNKLSHNEMSQGRIRNDLQSAVRDQHPKEEYVWVEEVYETYFVYSIKDTLYKQDYSNEKGVISVSGTPVEVERVIEYREKTIKSNERNKSMDKKQMVDGLIQNTNNSLTEEDREMLMGLEEATLDRIANSYPKANAEPPAKKEDEEEDEEKDEEDEKKTSTNEAPLTADEYIQKAPPEIQEILNEGRQAAQTERGRLVKIITANKKNPYTNEELQAMSLAQLRKTASLAGTVSKAPAPIYLGQADPVDNEVKEEGFTPPTMNFGKK